MYVTVYGTCCNNSQTFILKYVNFLRMLFESRSYYKTYKRTLKRLLNKVECYSSIGLLFVQHIFVLGLILKRKRFNLKKHHVLATKYRRLILQ